MATVMRTSTHKCSGWMFSHLDFPCRFYPPPSFNPSGQHPGTFTSIWRGQPVFFKPGRLPWEPPTSMRKACTVYFAHRETVMDVHQGRQECKQTASSGCTLPVGVCIERLRLPGKRRCCLYPGCPYFPSVPWMFLVPRTPGIAPTESADRRC